MLPAARSAMASLRGALRLVGFEPPYSRLRLAKPVAPRGSPTLAATLKASPSPSPERPGVQLERAARGVVLELEVHDPGDGVRAVLRRRPVSQHLDLPERDGRDDGDVEPLRPEGDAVAAVPVDDRRAVAALAVDEDQGCGRGRGCAASRAGPPSRRRLMGWVLTLNDGATVRSWSCWLTAPWLVRSEGVRTSTGTGDSATVRGCARVPTTTRRPGPHRETGPAPRSPPWSGPAPRSPPRSGRAPPRPGPADPTLSVSRCPTVGARPAVFPGQVDVFPAER